LQGVLSARTAQGVAYDLRNQLYAKIQALSFSCHDRAQTGQLLTRATSNLEMVHMFIGMGFIHPLILWHAVMENIRYGRLEADD